MNYYMSKRMNEAEVLLRRLEELHDDFLSKGCPSDQVTRLVSAMMAVLTQKVFIKNPTQEDLMEFPTRLLNADMVWSEFVKKHSEALIYTPDLFRKWVWGLYRGHLKTRNGLWGILGWKPYDNVTDVKEEVGDAE